MSGSGIESQAELARITKIKPQTINAWMKGTSMSMDGLALIKVSRALNCNPAWLITGSGKKDPKNGYDYIDEHLLANCIHKIEDAIFWLDKDIPIDIRSEMIAKLYLLGGSASQDEVKEIIHSTSDTA